MVTFPTLDDKFFGWLVKIDEEAARRVAEQGCRLCGGPLHRGDYPRKPRGGLMALAGEVFSRRISLCCGTDGCRRRSMPPSVRFLGRRVYLGVAVVLASALLCQAAVKEVKRATGVPIRTVRRWGAWWQQEFPQSPLYQEQRGSFLPPLEVTQLPASLVERFAAAQRSDPEVLARLLCFLSPLTTGSVQGGACFLRAE